MDVFIRSSKIKILFARDSNVFSPSLSVCGNWWCALSGMGDTLCCDSHGMHGGLGGRWWLLGIDFTLGREREWGTSRATSKQFRVDGDFVKLLSHVGKGIIVEWLLSIWICWCTDVGTFLVTFWHLIRNVNVWPRIESECSDLGQSRWASAAQWPPSLWCRVSGASPNTQYISSALTTLGEYRGCLTSIKSKRYHSLLPHDAQIRRIHKGWDHEVFGLWENL